MFTIIFRLSVYYKLRILMNECNCLRVILFFIPNSKHLLLDPTLMVLLHHGLFLTIGLFRVAWIWIREYE